MIAVNLWKPQELQSTNWFTSLYYKCHFVSNVENVASFEGSIAI